MQVSAIGLGLKLLERNEVAHMANGLHRTKHPQESDLDPDLVQTYDELSSGLVRKLVDLVG